jgi:hypothetical protein
MTSLHNYVYILYLDSIYFHLFFLGHNVLESVSVYSTMYKREIFLHRWEILKMLLSNYVHQRNSEQRIYLDIKIAKDAVQVGLKLTL